MAWDRWSLVSQLHCAYLFTQKFLESELDNNKEKEKKVGVAERQAAKLRLDHQDAEQNRIQMQDQVSQPPEIV